jgi:hypothetical protein
MGILIPIYGEIKNVPNHQPDRDWYFSEGSWKRKTCVSQPNLDHLCFFKRNNWDIRQFSSTHVGTSIINHPPVITIGLPFPNGWWKLLFHPVLTIWFYIYIHIIIIKIPMVIWLYGDISSH